MLPLSFFLFCIFYHSFNKLAVYVVIDNNFFHENNFDMTLSCVDRIVCYIYKMLIDISHLSISIEDTYVSRLSKFTTKNKLRDHTVASYLLVVQPRQIDAILAAALVTKPPATLWLTWMLEACELIVPPGLGTVISGQATLGT